MIHPIILWRVGKILMKELKTAFCFLCWIVLCARLSGGAKKKNTQRRWRSYVCELVCVLPARSDHSTVERRRASRETPEQKESKGTQKGRSNIAEPTFLCTSTFSSRE